MNKNFKVVFSKARGALMVVNELTSSVQAKGTKTVVASVAAALLSLGAGSALAAEAGTAVANPTLEQFKQGFSGMSFTSSGFDIKATADIAVGAVYKDNQRASADSMVYGTIFNTGSRAPEFVLNFNQAQFVNNQLKGTNKGSALVAGGALFLKGTSNTESTTFADTLFANNVVTGTNASMMAAGGAIYLDAAKNATVGTRAATATITTTQDMSYVGNKVVSADEGKWYELYGSIGQSAGGFAFLDRQAVLNFDVQGGTLTIGEAGAKDGAVDSIASAILQNPAESSLIQKMGKGNLVINSDLKDFYARLHVAEGAMTVARDVTIRDEWSVTGGELHLANAEVGQIQAASGSFIRADTGVSTAVTLQGTPGKLVVSGGAVTADTLKISGVGVTVKGLSEGTKIEGYGVTVSGGTLSVNKLDVASGKAVLTGGLTKVANTLTVAAKDGLELNGGTLETKATNVFKGTTGADGKTTYDLSDAWKNVTVGAAGGVVQLQETGFDYTLDQLTAAQTKLANGTQASVQLALKGNLKLEANQKLDANTVGGLNVAGSTAVADQGAFTVTNTSHNTVVGAIDFGNHEAETVTVTAGNGKSVVLAGNGGEVFKNLSAKTTKLTANNLTLGNLDTSVGQVGVKTLEVETLRVVGDFAAKDVVVKTEGTVDGVLTVDTLKTTDANGVDVNGALVVNGAFDKDGKALADITGNVNVKGEGAVLTTNRAGFKAAAAKLDKADLAKSIVYVDRTLNLEGATVVVGTPAQAAALFAAPTPAPEASAPTPSTVTIGTDGLAVVEANAFLGQNNAAFGDATVDATAGEVLIVNVSKLGDVKLGKSVVETSNVATDSLYVHVDKAKFNNEGVASLVYAKGLHSDKTVDARLEGLFKQGASAKEMAVLNTLENEVYVTVDKDKKAHFNALGEAALEQATGGNATAGVFNVAYDANAQVTDAIVRHQLADHSGMGVWADVFYAKNEAKEIYGGYGYSADIYGGVLGFDSTFSCGATAGLALAVGSADADSEGAVFANKLESDFWGLSVYTAKDFGGLNVKADLGYMDFSNDFKGLGDASDATTLTFGVRGDFTAYQNGAFSVAPHFGLRYTLIDTDAVAFNDAQKMNVFELPLGVKFAGTFETNGWKVVPSYDLTIVPQFGDKDVNVFGKAGDMNVLTSGLFNNVIGVEATNGNLTFGLNAVYGAGSDERSNTQVNANVRYNF